MMTTEPIRLVMASDIHFGDRSMDQVEMTDAFRLTLFPLMATTDILFLNGDFFDTLVIFDNHSFDPIYNVILELIYLCEKHQVTLRVLQGTWTHDRNQCKRFGAFYKNSRSTFDFKLVETIDLEVLTIRDRDIRIVYVPDDLPYKSSDDIVEVIKNKMMERGWDKVDYACMHGFFDFTFPKNVSHENRIVFREEQFDFVTKLVDVGHVHQHRTGPLGKAISNGSFDRLVFGDEDPKGCLQVLDYPNHYTAHFVENKHSAIFDTIIFGSEDGTEEIRQKIDNHLASLRTDRKISLRFVVDTPEQYDAIKSWMKEVHPDVRIMRKRNSDKSDSQHLMIPSSNLITPTEKRSAPTRKTIAAFIRSYIPEDYALSIETIEGYLQKPT